MACSGDESEQTPVAGAGAGGGGDDLDGALRLTARCEPEPPRVGDNVLHITLRDAEDKGIAGATVTVDPQMPAMGHGSSAKAAVQDQGDGEYLASPVRFQMAGDWQVTVRASVGGKDIDEVFAYSVKR